MSEKIALLLIDVQNGFHDSYWGKRNNPQAEENIEKLLVAFRKKSKPVFHVQHLSLTPHSPLVSNQPGVEFMDFAKPMLGERIFQKNVNSAFIGTQLEEILRNNRIDTIVIAGISTDHCVSTSTRMASNLGFNTYVIADATIAFERIGFDGERYSADVVHAIALASLHEEFSTVMNTNAALNLLNLNSFMSESSSSIINNEV